jgi:hypothetical protein
MLGKKLSLAKMESYLAEKTQDTTEQIIDQCMYAVWETDNNLHTDNGGDWTYGSTYAGGWFWVVNGGSCSNYVSTRKVKKGEVPSVDGPTNYPVSNGKTLPVDRHVWLDLHNPDTVKIVAEKSYN